MESNGQPSSEWENRIVTGDIRQVAPDLPPNLADTIVTSPPYFHQRDYGFAGQIGREESPQEYVRELVAIFELLVPALRQGGSLWLVLGDKFHKGELLGIPWRVVLGLVDAGWVLRSECIWQKPNAMPSAATTRPTTDHESVFLLTRPGDYHYDADAIREPHVTFTEKSRMKGGRRHFGKRGGTPEHGKNSGRANLHDGRWDQAFHPLGRNKRTVWSIPLSKFRGAHFAVFPEPLVETCIRATCPPGGLVLDPFAGSGTAAAVAKRLGRRFLAVELSPHYSELARKRVAAVADVSKSVGGATRGQRMLHE